LLTVKSAMSSSGLLPFATSLYHGAGEKVYIGCRCVVYIYAAHMFDDWLEIDIVAAAANRPAHHSVV
jgi:hypothetical protein